MVERLKTALYRVATFVVLLNGAIACIAVVVGLYQGNLQENNIIIRWVEIILLSLNAILLTLMGIKSLMKIKECV